MQQDGSTGGSHGHCSPLQLFSNPRFDLLHTAETHIAVGNKSPVYLWLQLWSNRMSRRSMGQVHHWLSAGCTGFQITNKWQKYLHCSIIALFCVCICNFKSCWLLYHWQRAQSEEEGFEYLANIHTDIAWAWIFTSVGPGELEFLLLKNSQKRWEQLCQNTSILSEQTLMRKMSYHCNYVT